MLCAGARVCPACSKASSSFVSWKRPERRLLSLSSKESVQEPSKGGPVTEFASVLASKLFTSKQQEDLWQLICVNCGKLPIVSHDQLLGLVPQQTYAPTTKGNKMQWSAIGRYYTTASNLLVALASS